jgi:NADPH2:quinone reductase
MRAAFYDRQGLPQDVLELGNFPEPSAGAGEVRVKMAVSGINPSDAKHRAGWNGIAMVHPRIVPHQDGAGTIDQIGAGVDKARVGERVWVYEAANEGRAQGTAAEYVVVSARRAIPLPAIASFALGASLGVPAMTAHCCVFGDGSVDGATLLVAGGAGAVGRCAIQLARWGGARVIATAGSADQMAVARQAGADEVICYRDADAADQLATLAPGGFDRIVEVAPSVNIGMDVNLCRPGATIVAFASGDDPAGTIQIPARHMLSRRLSLKWVHVYTMPEADKTRAVDDINAALAARALTMPPATHYPLAEVVAAHQAIGTSGTGRKILLDIL